MLLLHKKNLRKLSLAALLAGVVGMAACGDSGEAEGTIFEAPAWVLALGNAGLSGSVTGDTGSGPGTGGGATFHGVRANIPGVATPLIVAEANAIETETQVTKVLTANGVGDDGSTVVTMQWTVLQTVSPPVTLNLVLFGPTDNNEVNFVYSETVTTPPPNAVTQITSGTLKLDKWNDIQVRGTFEGTVILADDTVRTISDGIIDVRF